MLSINQIIEQHISGLLTNVEDETKRIVFSSTNHPKTNIVVVECDMVETVFDFIRKRKADIKSFESSIETLMLFTQDENNTLLVLNLLELSYTDVLFGAVALDRTSEEWTLEYY